MKRLMAVPAVLGVLALIVCAAASAGGGNSSAAAACQQNGWQSLYRTDGSGFKNTGDCVSYAAHGGAFATKCQPGSWSATGVAACQPAPADTYVSTVGATAPTPCPPGTTTNGATGSTTADACQSSTSVGGGDGSN